MKILHVGGPCASTFKKQAKMSEENCGLMWPQIQHLAKGSEFKVKKLLKLGGLPNKVFNLTSLKLQKAQQLEKPPSTKDEK